MFRGSHHLTFSHSLLLYHDPDLYNHYPFHVIEALVKAYLEGILEPLYDGNQDRYPIETAVAGTSDETQIWCSNYFLKPIPSVWTTVRLSSITMPSIDVTQRFWN